MYTYIRVRSHWSTQYVGLHVNLFGWRRVHKTKAEIDRDMRTAINSMETTCCIRMVVTLTKKTESESITETRIHTSHRRKPQHCRMFFNAMYVCAPPSCRNRSAENGRFAQQYEPRRQYFGERRVYIPSGIRLCFGSITLARPLLANSVVFVGTFPPTKWFNFHGEPRPFVTTQPRWNPSKTEHE